jgi:hypothetical protein
MNDAKYIGMDVHQATISAAVRDCGGNVVMEATLETKSETILEFVHSSILECFNFGLGPRCHFSYLSIPSISELV